MGGSCSIRSAPINGSSIDDTISIGFGNNNKTDFHWDEYQDILPASLWITLLSAAGWGLLYILTFLRRCKHFNSATKNTRVGTKMQHLQIWFYSLLFTVNYLLSAALVISFAMDSQWVIMALLIVFIALGTVAASTVDIVGSLYRDEKRNQVDPVVALQYVLTIYLPKAVWKISGHTERLTIDELNDRKSNGTPVSYCCSCEDNERSPGVYDVKDVLGLQAVFQSAPALLLYVIAIVKCPEIDTVTFRVAASVAFVTVLVPVLLGDWEASTKDFNHKGLKKLVVMIFSLLKRIIELCGRIGFYVYFEVVTGFLPLLILIDWALMYITYINLADFPAVSRFSRPIHRIFVSLGAVFFGFYRRLGADKEFTNITTQMPAAIELVRYVFKISTTALGYFIIIGLGAKQGWFYVEEDRTFVSAVFFIGIGCSIVLVVILIAEFLLFRKKTVHKADFLKLYNYWKGWWLCKNLICIPAEEHINRDLGGYHTGRGIAYV